MRKIVLFSMVLTILALMFTGCEKPENPVPPGPAPVFYTLSSTTSGKGSVNPDKVANISLGSDITVKFIPEAGYSLYSVKVNNVAVEIQPSSSEVSYTIKNVTSNVRVEVIFVETNNLIISTNFYPSPWKYVSMDIYRENGTFYFTFPLTQEEKNRNMFFYFNYPKTSYTEVLTQEGVRFFYADWSIMSQNTLRVSSTNYTIVELSATRLVYKAPPVIGSDKTYTYAQYTFERK